MGTVNATPPAEDRGVPVLELRRRFGPTSPEFLRRYRELLAMSLRYRTDRLVGISHGYLERLDKNATTVSAVFNAAMTQVRQVMSDAFRDEGCDEEDLHALVLNGWGSDFARTLIRNWADPEAK